MEFIIISEPLELTGAATYDWDRRKWYILSKPEVSLLPNTVHYGDDSYNTKMLNTLEAFIDRKRGSEGKKWRQIYVERANATGARLGMASIVVNPVLDEKELHFAIRDGDDLNYHLSRLEATFGEENVTFEFELNFSVGGYRYPYEEHGDDGSKNIVIFRSADQVHNPADWNLFLYVHKVFDLLGPREWAEAVQILRGHLTVTLKISDKAVNYLFTDSLEGPLRKMLKKMQQDPFAPDSVLEVMGTEFRCHKEVLVARSSTFKLFFGSSMKEGVSSNTIKMDEMGVESVQALLSYVYTYDMEEISKSCVVAYDLLKAGNFYEIEGLEENVIDVLFSKNVDWYTVDVIVQLLQLARVKVWYYENEDRNLARQEDYKRLEKMALAALMEKNSEELKNSLVLQETLQSVNVGADFFLYVFHAP